MRASPMWPMLLEHHGRMMYCLVAEAHALHVQSVHAPTDLTDRHDKTHSLTARVTDTDRQTDRQTDSQPN